MLHLVVGGTWRFELVGSFGWGGVMFDTFQYIVFVVCFKNK